MISLYETKVTPFRFSGLWGNGTAATKSKHLLKRQSAVALLFQRKADDGLISRVHFAQK